MFGEGTFLPRLRLRSVVALYDDGYVTCDGSTSQTIEPENRAVWIREFLKAGVTMVPHPGELLSDRFEIGRIEATAAIASELGDVDALSVDRLVRAIFRKATPVVRVAEET